MAQGLPVGCAQILGTYPRVTFHHFPWDFFEWHCEWLYSEDALHEPVFAETIAAFVGKKPSLRQLLEHSKCGCVAVWCNNGGFIVLWFLFVFHFMISLS